MKYNPNIHHRRSIRLQGYDYSQNGAYFITICTQDRKNFFGEINGGQILKNDAALMVDKWYNELSNKYPNIELNEFVIMPNPINWISDQENPESLSRNARPCVSTNTKYDLL